MEVAIIGAQSGDEGKGKFTDILAGGADLLVRFQGGPHTGHTVVADGHTTAFVQLPAGITRGVRGLLGNGCVVDPEALLNEMSAHDITRPEQLLVSEKAHVVLPHHRLQDQAMEQWRGQAEARTAADGLATGGGQLGSTRKGVGPCREDKVARIGLRMIDLLDQALLRDRLQTLIPLKRSLLTRVFGMAEGLMDSELDVENTVQRYHQLGIAFEPFLADAGAAIRHVREQAGTIVFEGAQSLGLDIEHGTYPYCSTGHSGGGGIAVGTGAPARDVTYLGVVKAYMAQVGGGPLPTSIDGVLADRLIERGREHGTVTGRRRRVGWFDAAFVRRAVRTDGLDALAVTNLDVLADVGEVSICTHYELDGECLDEYPVAHAAAARIRPIYTTMPGWPEFDADTVARKGYDALPRPARDYLERLAELTDTRIAAVSFGRERHHTCWVGPGLALEKITQPRPSARREGVVLDVVP